MAYKNTCYLCGFATSSCTPAEQRRQLILNALGFSPKTYGEWGICPRCVVGLNTGAVSWMKKYAPRGFVPYAWRGSPKVLAGGRKKRRAGSGRPAAVEKDLEAVSLPSNSDLLDDFRSFRFLNQHDKARYFERVAEQAGVLHLLKSSQASCSVPEPSSRAGGSKISRAKSYASDLRLSQKKLQCLATEVNRDCRDRILPSRRAIQSSIKEYKSQFIVRDSYVVAENVVDFVCDFFGLSRSCSSDEDPLGLVVGLDYGGGSLKVVVRPYNLSGGHGCLIGLHSEKDSRAITEEVMRDIQCLAGRFRLWFSGDNKQLQLLIGTSSTACWACGVVEKRKQGRHVYDLEAAEDRWVHATKWAHEYSSKVQRLKRPPCHINGQKFVPLVEPNTVLLPWLHILMGLCRNVFDHMVRCGASREALEALLKNKLNITPTKPISGSTLERTNTMGFTGKDCKVILSKVADVKAELEGLPKGAEAYRVIDAIETVRFHLMRPNALDDVKNAIEEFRAAYQDGGFNPSLTVHLLVAHGAQLYEPHSSASLRLLTEEMVERVHFDINDLNKRSQIRSDLLEQITRWNWQYSAKYSPQSPDHTTSRTPPTKRARIPTRRSPQVTLSAYSSLAPVSASAEAQSDHSEYAETATSRC